MISLKKQAKRVIHSVGFDIHRLNPESNDYLQLLRSLHRFGVDTVFDIGASIGHFAAELRSVGFAGDIVSFEPLSDAHRALSQAARGDARWHVHTRCALGDHDGEIAINIAGNSLSSSVLPMTEAHSAAAEGSAYVGSERVPIRRLDQVTPLYFQAGRRLFLKIDTQGFEWQVLDGAPETLAQARGVLCELSLVPLYEGQHLWMDLIRRLEAEGFTLWSVKPVFIDPRDGRTLQLDAVFFRA